MYIYYIILAACLYFDLKFCARAGHYKHFSIYESHIYELYCAMGFDARRQCLLSVVLQRLLMSLPLSFVCVLICK